MGFPWILNRKDSFITHRAFCDALAEESARLTSVATTNLNFKNEESGVMNNNSHQPGLAHGLIATGQGLHQNVAGIPQFGPHGFRLDFNGMENRPSLSLWLNQGNHHQINNSPHDVGPNSGLYNVSSCSSGLPEIVQMAQANTNSALIGSSSILSNFGVPSSNSTSANLSLSSLPIGKRGELGGTSDHNLASIYSSEGQSKQSKPANSSPMSATALLQKAAQMGSTRSTNPSIFSGSFGVMTSSTASQTTALNNNNNNAKHAGNFDSTSSSAAMMGNPASFSSLTHSSNSFDPLVMQTCGQHSEPVKLKFHHGSNSVEHSLTRDFLGVSGGGGAGPQFLPQELAKFASIGSPMGLNQFTSNQ